MNAFLDNLEDLVLDVLDWIFSTKLGHFLFNVFLTTIIGIILHWIFPSIPLLSIIVGGAIAGIYFAIIDDSDKWI